MTSLISQITGRDAVAAIIEEIERLLAADAAIDDFVKQIWALVKVVPLSKGTHHRPGTRLYRATNHHITVPRRIEEIWYPPAEKAGLGRANRPNQPVFYCCSGPGGAFAELGVGIGQYAVHATWENTAQMDLHDLGYTAKALERTGSRRAVPEGHRKFYEIELCAKGSPYHDAL
jgi:hypothetical protein